jgi:hypothetical protein
LVLDQLQQVVNPLTMLLHTSSRNFAKSAGTKIDEINAAKSDGDKVSFVNEYAASKTRD